MLSVSVNSEKRFENKDCLFPFIMAALSVPVFIAVFIRVTFISDPLEPYWLYSFILALPTSLFVLFGILAFKGKISVFANVLFTMVLIVFSLVFMQLCTLALIYGANVSQHHNPSQYPRVYRILSEENSQLNACIKNVFPSSVPEYAKNVQFRYTDGYGENSNPVSMNLSFDVSDDEIADFIKNLDGKEEYSYISVHPDSNGKEISYKTVRSHGMIVYSFYEFFWVTVDTANDRISFTLSYKY